VIAFFVLMSATMLVAPRQRPFLTEAKLGLMISLVMFGVLGAWGIVTSIGLLRLRNWGRISIIVFSVFLALIGLGAGPLILLIPSPPNVPQNFGTVRIVIAIVYGAFGVLGALWLYYFNRRSTCDAFGGTSTPDGGRPLSISIIGWWFLLAGIGTITAIPLRMPGSLFVWVVTGWSAAVCYLVFSALSAYVGYGLLRLNPIARVIGICWLCFGAVNGVVFFALPGHDARIRNLMAHFAWGQQSAPHAQFPPLFYILVMVIGVAVPLWFLVTRKTAFERSNGTPLR